MGHTFSLTFTAKILVPLMLHISLWLGAQAWVQGGVVKVVGKLGPRDDGWKLEDTGNDRKHREHHNKEQDSSWVDS